MIAAAGIDSWSPCWYLDRESAAAKLVAELATAPAARGMLLPKPVAGHRVGWNAASGMLYAEGHPCGAMPGEWSPDPFVEAAVDRVARERAERDRQPWLVPPDRLSEAYSGLVDALEASGVPVPASQWATRLTDDYVLPGDEGLPGFGGLRRCDATVDLQAGSRARGLAILAGVAAVATTAPRAQAEVRFAKDGSGAVETVYLRGYAGVKILGRWYDKGLESASAPRGLVIRAEDQRRYPKGHRRGIEELEATYVKRQFQQRWLPLWQATKGVTVAGVLVIADKLKELVEEGEISPRKAEQLAGYVVLQRGGGVGGRGSRATTYRRRKDLRELGLVVADGVLEEVEVDLHEVLDEALESPAWHAAPAALN
jgi:hypothetical protein